MHLSDNFAWSAQNWRRPDWHEYMIYELHVLRFTSRNTEPNLSYFGQVTKEIEKSDGTDGYIKRLGFTAIELMPVNEFPGNESWGYNPAYFYAIDRRYGTADELKLLIDTAHRKGIAVIFDIVFNHAGQGNYDKNNPARTDNILGEVDHNEYYKGGTAWGPRLNYDSDVARHFFVQNLIYLAKEFRVDGFRFDMTGVIHNRHDYNLRDNGEGFATKGWDFLRQMRAGVKAFDHKIFLMAEELPDNWYVTKKNIGVDWDGNNDYHAPFDSQWNDEFHDYIEKVVRGEHLDNLKNHVFKHFGDNWFNSVNYIESHDEVGNEDKRTPRISRDGKGWEMSQLMGAAVILSRGLPLIFMGQEGGEIKQFGIHDWDDRIPIDDYETNPARAKILDWYKKMVEIRKYNLPLFARERVKMIHVHNDHGICAFARGDNDRYVIVLNFNNRTWFDYGLHNINGFGGYYKELANTSWPRYNISGTMHATRGGWEHHNINTVHIPAYGAVVLEKY